MRRRLLLGITIGLCAYVLLGGFIFHVLESNHEDETINETLDAYYDLLREYIIYDIRKNHWNVFRYMEVKMGQWDSAAHVMNM